jgi:hypothetical protein
MSEAKPSAAALSGPKRSEGSQARGCGRPALEGQFQ